MMNYSEVFLLGWAVLATVLCVARGARVKFYQTLLAAMAETTEKITFSDEARAEAQAVYNRHGASKYSKPNLTDRP